MEEDIDSEVIEIDVEDYDNKLALSDEIDMTQNCIPTLNIKNSDNTPITHNFLKTYFELEKVRAKVPNSDKTTPVLVLFDGGSGTTVGNHLEDLDGSRLDTLKTGHNGHQRSPLYVILGFYCDFHLFSMNRSRSRTPCLEVIINGD